MVLVLVLVLVLVVVVVLVISVLEGVTVGVGAFVPVPLLFGGFIKYFTEGKVLFHTVVVFGVMRGCDSTFRTCG